MAPVRMKIRAGKQSLGRETGIYPSGGAKSSTMNWAGNGSFFDSWSPAVSHPPVHSDSLAPIVSAGERLD